MSECISDLPAALEEKAREISVRHFLSDAEREFLLDFISHLTLEILGVEDEQGSRELREREGEISSPRFDKALVELKNELWNLHTL